MPRNLHDEIFDGEGERAYRTARFRDPYGKSALHPGARTEPCPTCEVEDSLTKKDVASGYQCDACADRAEGGGY